MVVADTIVTPVWQKGQVVAGYNPDEWRKDQCGAWIGRTYHGNRNSKFGWEIDHITPQSQGGTDHISNLRPLQWQNNASKQDGRLVCVVTADGNHNN